MGLQKEYNAGIQNEVTMEQTITFNGKTYRSLEDMPPEVRQAYESLIQIMADQNQNGVPDLFEGQLSRQVRSTRTTNIVYNGQSYNNLNELPPEARAKYEAFMGQWDTDHNGLPDFAEKLMGGSAPTPANPPSSRPMQEPAFSQSPSIPVSPTIEPEPTGLSFGILAAMLLFVLCLGAVAFYILYTQL